MLKTKGQKITIIILLILIMVINFSKNILNTNKTNFNTFSSGSEYLVFSKIFDKENLDNNKYGLETCLDKNNQRIENIYDYINNDNNNEIHFESYKSQFGLQGFVFSFLYNKLRIPFFIMKFICCLLLAIILLTICYLISYKYDKIMGIVFYITFLLSPWIVSFARNLYWVEFTWFLPMLLGLLLSTNYKKKKIIIPSIYVSILIKCLCGYEYISTIMLSTILFFIVDLFEVKGKEKRKEIIKTMILVGITCLIAFFTALCIHGYLRGNGNVFQGIKDIYKQDIIRRTLIHAEKDDFDQVYWESFDASVIKTLRKYTIWNTDIIQCISGNNFMLVIGLTIFILMFNFINKIKHYYRDIIMFILFLSTTLSWLILAKSHSYIHTHLNFVLWYFGFIQFCLYKILIFFSKTICYIGQDKQELMNKNK